jgi:hypothetical protein
MSKPQGEGEPVSGKKTQDAWRRYAKDGPVKQAGREAGAAEGRTDKAEAKRRIIRRERNLDEGLEETYPASDPVSVHPGSD